MPALMPLPPSLPPKTQIKCGDRYADSAIDTFNSCVVSQQKCVPQRVDKGAAEAADCRCVKCIPVYRPLSSAFAWLAVLCRAS